jgi:gluconokinase
MPTILKPPFVLALDVGTSSTRALLFDARGAAVPHVVSQRPYPLTLSAQGEASVNAEVLAALVEETIDETLSLAGSCTQQIVAVSLDTFWHSLLGVDAVGRPLTPVITWEDTRPRDAVSRLRAQFDEQVIHSRTGVHFHASYWPAKLLWLSESHPELFAQVAQWISFGEYLHRRFLGRSLCSLSMASGTGLLNLATLQWDTELIQALGIHPEQLPSLAQAYEGIQGLTRAYAAAWPALHRIPWFPAIGDGAAACLGSGCVDTTCWSVTIGTSSALRVVVEPGRVLPPPGLWLALLDAKRAVLGGALSEGGNVLHWLCQSLQLPSLQDAEPFAAALAPDSHALTLLPFLFGERSLGWHSEARLTITGLSHQSAPIEILRAGYEALAYRLLAVHQRLGEALQNNTHQHTLHASGGVLLGSSLMKSILADTLGLPLFPSQESEASARGTALLALEALGVLPDLASVAPVLLEPTWPNLERSHIYRRAAKRQEKLYQTLFGASFSDDF